MLIVRSQPHNALQCQAEEDVFVRAISNLNSVSLETLKSTVTLFQNFREDVQNCRVAFQVRHEVRLFWKTKLHLKGTLMSSFSFVGVIFLRAVFFSSLSRSLDWSNVSFLFQCLKESYVKATGTGIGRDLQSVEFQINTKELSPQVCSAPT